MATTVRPLAFYWREKIAVEASKVSVEFTLNREPIFGQAAIEAWTKGLATMKVTASGFTGVGGSYTSNDIERILRQEDIPFGIVLGGKYFREKGAVTSLKYDSDSEKGTLTEEITFMSKLPQITG